MSNFNWVDNVVLFLFLISVLAGLMRGLIREVIALITWIAAIIVATMFSGKLAAAFTSSSSVQSTVSNATASIGLNAAHPVSLLSIGISFLLLFIGVLIIGSLVNSVISRAVESGGISFINRTLGGLFGLARGFLLVLVIVFIVQLTPLMNEAWWQQSQFVNYFQPTVDKLNQWVAPGLSSLKDKVSNKLEDLKAR